MNHPQTDVNEKQDNCPQFEIDVDELRRKNVSGGSSCSRQYRTIDPTEYETVEREKEYQDEFIDVKCKPLSKVLAAYRQTRPALIPEIGNLRNTEETVAFAKQELDLQVIMRRGRAYVDEEPDSDAGIVVRRGRNIAVETGLATACGCGNLGREIRRAMCGVCGGCGGPAETTER